VTTKRNISFMIPKYLLDQILVRAHVAGVSRNAEMRALVTAGLVAAGEDDFPLEFAVSPPTRAIVWIDDEIVADVAERAKRYGRSMGKELVRLLGFGLQTGVNRDLELIAKMMLRQGQPAH
jgi:plasmid stability protein